MIDLLEVALPDLSSTIVLTTCSSDGFIHLYDLVDLEAAVSTRPSHPAVAGEEPTVEPAAKFDTDKSRLTCVCAIGLVERVPKLAGTEGDDEDDEDEDEEESDDDSEEEEEEGDEAASGSEGELLSGEEDEFAGFEDEVEVEAEEEED